MKVDLPLFESYAVSLYRASDLPALLHHADDAGVAGHLRDAFPHPYTEEAGSQWIAYVLHQDPPLNFAIRQGQDLIGGIGLTPQSDVFRFGVEIGYWLGREFWGRSIATHAVDAVTEYAFEQMAMRRVFAGVFESNPASMRVLEKCGFQREGILRQSVYKAGRFLDQALYAKIAP